MSRISTIMPVYDAPENFLREAIDSILSQSFTDFEFIIINDGSSNNAGEVIKSYSDPRIIYVENEQNLGLIASLNKGLSLAKGEYIARMDSDDISHTDRFKKQVEYLDSHPEVGVLGTWYKKFGKREAFETPFTTSFAIKMQLLLGSSVICHPSAMFRRSLNAKYDPKWRHAEDYALWLELLDQTEFANLDECLLYYRWHGGNICKKHSLMQGINSQMLMTIVQAQHFGLPCEDVLSTIEKLSLGGRISSAELSRINLFVLDVKMASRSELAKDPDNSEISKVQCLPSRVFYKYAISQTRKDGGFCKALFSKELDSAVKLGLPFKLLQLFTV